jgi:hypothetical protein
MSEAIPTPLVQALLFLKEHPHERPITAAQIYNVNSNTFNSALQRLNGMAQRRTIPEAAIRILNARLE